MRFNASIKLILRTATALALAAAMPATGWGQGESGQDKATPTSKVERLNRAPVSKEILKVKLPRPVETVLPNGIHVMILEDHRFPLVTVQFDINGAGPLYEPANLPGLAGATARLLDEGTRTRTSKQIAEQIDSLGASLSALRRRSGRGQKCWEHKGCPTHLTIGSHRPPMCSCTQVFPPMNWRNISRARSPL